MYELDNGKSILKEWRVTEDEESSEPLKNLTFRAKSSLQERVDEYVSQDDVPFESRSQLTRISLKLFLDSVEGKNKGELHAEKEC